MGLQRSKIDGYMFPSVKGKYYDKATVDAFLMDIANDADDSLLELSECKKRIRELEKREESIAQALVIVKELSTQILDKAKTEAEKIIMESTARKLEIEEEITRLEAVRDTYKSDLEAEIKSIMADMLKRVQEE